jgi:enoyl-CoA hydratase/carnithine racemase
MTELFNIPISTGGSFVCSTVPQQNKIYLLSFTSPPDNRLTPQFLEAYLLSLDILEHRFPPGVLITTSGIQKFFSNGLDLEKAMTMEGFFPNYLFKLFRRLLTWVTHNFFLYRLTLTLAENKRYPFPTVALVNGHAFAGGFMTAMYHDYRVQNPSRGFLSMNEIFLGVGLRTEMSVIFLDKVASHATRRSIIVEGKRFSGPEALGAGLVDALGGLDEAVKLVQDKKLLDLGKSPAYVPLKEALYKRTLAALDNGADRNQAELDRLEDVRHEYAKEAVARVKQWDAKREAAKL